MNLDEIIGKVSPEQLYKHVYRLQGVRHPLTNPKALKEATDYIHDDLKSSGLDATRQEFKVKGYPDTYANIIGTLQNTDTPQLLITGHHDTVWNSPGADDNASAVAIMLETARILAQIDAPLNIRFISYDLEERTPAFESRYIKLAQDKGLLDDNWTPTTLKAGEFLKHFNRQTRTSAHSGEGYSKGIDQLKADMGSRLTKNELDFLDKAMNLYAETDSDHPLGGMFLKGSDYAARESKKQGKEIAGIINMDTVGYISQQPHSNTYPKGIDPTVFPAYKVEDHSTGNFLIVIGNKNSTRLLQTFCAACKHTQIQLTNISLPIPYDYQTIEKTLYDVLRSDHAPYWREGYHGVFLTDMANFRTPYYHTHADTIDKLDFQFMTKICKAIITTALNLTNT